MFGLSGRGRRVVLETLVSFKMNFRDQRLNSPTLPEEVYKSKVILLTESAKRQSFAE